MGRRSINTTKSGKYMNPTDQARKEARKRELKKNKKQRQMVRAAVLKGKDPIQLISDLEKIDEMEYNVNTPPLLNEKVLKDKRKKLRETWDRVMRLYFKEDKERYNELKKLEIEYETKRAIMVKYYESVRIAQQVQVDEIPLPDTPEMPVFLMSQIPLPSEMEGLLPESLIIPHSILKKTQSFIEKDISLSHLRAPGIPPGPIPYLSSDEEDIDEEDISNEHSKNVENQENKYSKSRKIRFADENNPMDDDEENEESMDTLNFLTDSVEASKLHKLEDIPIPPMPPGLLAPGPPPRLPQGLLPNVQALFRPPPLGSNIPLPPRVISLPPGRPSLPPPGLPIRLGAPPMRLPPGPPPGVPPPRLLRPLTAPPPRITASAPNSGPSATINITVLSAPPNLMQRPKGVSAEEEAQRSATIEAKPQIRNLSADIMRFTPTTLRIKREDRHRKGGSKSNSSYDQPKDTYSSIAPASNQAISAPTKDDAYQQFLREVESLL